jgi:hypothetical protein
VSQIERYLIRLNDQPWFTMTILPYRSAHALAREVASGGKPEEVLHVQWHLGQPGEDLALHLVSTHWDPMAICRTVPDNVAQHAHEHQGPGTLRNHDPAWLGYDETKIEEVLDEAEEMA